MRSSLLVLTLSWLPLAPAVRAGGPYPSPGSDIPGPFSAYNATGKFKGRYHCLVSEHGLNPVVMVVIRGAEVKEAGLRNLLVKLDNAVDKNPVARLASFAVFLPDTIADVARDDDKRDEVETKLEDLKKDAGLKHVTLALDVPAHLAAWKLDKDADVIVVLYREYRTVAVHTLSWEQLKEKDNALPAKVKEILGQVREKLGATR